MEAINLNDKFTKINDHWNPRIIGELNDTYVKAVKIQGEFHCIITTMKTSSSSSSKAACA